MTSSWRNPPTPPTQEELAAVNELLQSIGQAPVSTLDTSNPDVSIAWNTLVSTSRDVQAEGWTFNRENNIQSIRSNSTSTMNMLLLADNELQVDLVDNIENKYHNAVVRGEKIGSTFVRFLYDRFTHSTQWNYNPYVNKIFLFKWEELPIPMQSFIIARAAALCSMRITGDMGQYKMLQERESYCRTQAMEYETTQGGYNYMGMDSDVSTYRTYQPFTSLYRY